MYRGAAPHHAKQFPIASHRTRVFAHPPSNLSSSGALLQTMRRSPSLSRQENGQFGEKFAQSSQEMTAHSLNVAPSHLAASRRSRARFHWCLFSSCNHRASALREPRAHRFGHPVRHHRPCGSQFVQLNRRKFGHNCVQSELDLFGPEPCQCPDDGARLAMEGLETRRELRVCVGCFLRRQYRLRSQGQRP